MSVDASKAEAMFEQYLAGHEADRDSFEQFVVGQPEFVRSELRELWADFLAGIQLLHPIRNAVAGQTDPIASLRAMCRADASRTYRDAIPLTAGGMSQIELIYDAKLDRRLVRKILPIHIDRPGRPGDRRQVVRFLNEVRITSRMQHPAILTIVEAGIDESGRPFYTMPVVRGDDLARIFERHHSGASDWSRARVLQVLVDVCGALEYAHDRGVVHRDIKPQNIMVGRFGETFVMDWGLAKLVETELEAACEPPEAVAPSFSLLADVPGATLDGDIIGTPAFMAPEQANGDLGAIAPATDQYALGATLYFLLAGKQPYEDVETATTPKAVVRLVRSESPRSLHDLAPQAPPELVAIVEQAMARRPEDRYPDIGRLAADLRAFLDQRAVSAYDDGTWASLRLWMRRNRVVTCAIALALLMVIGSLAWLNFVQARQQGELSRVNTELVVAERESTARLVETQRSLYYHTITSVSQQLELGEDFGQLRDMLDRCPAEFRDWEWHFLDQVEDSSVRKLAVGDAGGGLDVSADEKLLAIGAEGGVHIHDMASGRQRFGIPAVHDPHFSPRGDRVLVRRGSRRLEIWDVASARQVATMDGGRQTTCCCWTRGGREVVCGVAATPGAVQAGVRFFDSESGTLLREVGHGKLVSVVASSLVGDRVASAGGGVVKVWTSRTGKALLDIAVPNSGSFVELRFDPLCRRLTAVLSTGRELRFDARSGRLVCDVALPTTAPLSAASVRLDPTLNRLAYVEQGSLHIYDLERRVLLQRRYGGHGMLGSPRFLLRERSVLAASTNRLPATVWSREKQVWRPLRGYGPSEVLRVAISPDGHRVAATGWANATCVWDPRRPGHVLRVPGTSEDPKRLLAFSPDGECLLVEAPDHSACIWRCESGRVDRRLPVKVAWAGTGAWSPDGRWVWISNDKNRWVQVDLETGRIVVTPLVSRNRRLVFSMDGAVAYLLTDNGIVARDNASMHEEWRLASRRAGSVALSPDSKWLAIGFDGGDIALLDPKTGHERSRFHAQIQFINQLAFTPSGRRLLSVSYSGTLKVWDPFKARQLLRLRPDRQPFQDLALSADGKLLVAAGRSGVIHTWSLR